jgi:hypothetical protein
VETAGGDWLQDSMPIIDSMEARHPELPIIPENPPQVFCARLLDDYADACGYGGRPSTTDGAAQRTRPANRIFVCDFSSFLQEVRACEAVEELGDVVRVPEGDPTMAIHCLDGLLGRLLGVEA